MCKSQNTRLGFKHLKTKGVANIMRSGNKKPAGEAGVFHRWKF